MADQNNSSNPILGIIYTLISWLSVTLTITIQHVDVILRLGAHILAIITGVMALINWYWAIKRNRKAAKKDIPF